MIDVDKAKLSWPNFATFYEWFKNHPSLSPGNVKDSGKVREDKTALSGEAHRQAQDAQAGHPTKTARVWLTMMSGRTSMRMFKLTKTMMEMMTFHSTEETLCPPKESNLLELVKKRQPLLSVRCIYCQA
jgi:hypothetical protein